MPDQAKPKRSAGLGRLPVCSITDLPPGTVRLIEVAGQQVGVFSVNGQFVAYLNYCPHEGAPVCAGRITALTHADRPGELRMTRDNELLCCPWHGWEFDLHTGQCLVDRSRLLKYETEVEAGQLYVLPRPHKHGMAGPPVRP